MPRACARKLVMPVRRPCPREWPPRWPGTASRGGWHERATAQPSNARPMKHYTFVDYATQAYAALVGLLVLLFHNHTVPGWQWLLAAHLLCLCLVHLLIRWHARSE